jgi:uncharacterized protein (DUF1330 family)
MKTNAKLGLAMLAGCGLGAGVVHELHAQAAPPAYVVSEIEIVDEDGYSKQYLPFANKALADAGQKRLASAGDAVSIVGDPPKSRIVVAVFENMEKAQAAYASAAFQDAQKIGEKYAKLRIYAVEGLAP